MTKNGQQGFFISNQLGQWLATYVESGSVPKCSVAEVNNTLRVLVEFSKQPAIEEAAAKVKAAEDKLKEKEVEQKALEDELKETEMKQEALEEAAKILSSAEPLPLPPDANFSDEDTLAD